MPARRSGNENPEGVRAFRNLERLLGRLDDCTVMTDAEMEFVEDLCQRVMRDGQSVAVTKPERRELARLERRYL